MVHLEAPRAHSRERAHDETTPWSPCDDAKRRPSPRERSSSARRRRTPPGHHHDARGRRAVIAGALADIRRGISRRPDRAGSRADANASGTAGAPRCGSRETRVEHDADARALTNERSLHFQGTRLGK